MRHRPATGAASFVDLSRLPSRRQGRQDDGTGPTALTRSATFTSTGGATAIHRIAFTQLMRQPAAQPAPRAGRRGGRNARATSTRSRAFPISPGNSPSRIASCHQRHRNHRSASVGSSNVFAEPTLGENVAARNRKSLPACEQAVDDATSLWKPEENAGEILATASDAVDLMRFRVLHSPGFAIGARDAHSF